MGHRSRRVANSNPIRLALGTGFGGRKQQQNRRPNNSTKTQLHSETSVLNQQSHLRSVKEHNKIDNMEQRRFA
jgi:hypothetical protein